MKKRFGQVPDSHEWVVQRHPEPRVQVSRVSLEMLQAENAMLHDVLEAARRAVSGPPSRLTELRVALSLYDGWVDDPEMRDQIVEKLLAIAEDLDDEGP